MIKGGTVYPLGVKKTLRFQTIAMENRLPMIVLTLLTAASPWFAPARPDALA